jgi:NAD(P)-dependent dehydrogenase (short-subunit alcohol dehydrogenase family)
MTRSLDGAVVAVVGASGGLGAPISAELVQRGATVVLAGRSADRLAAVPDVPADALRVELDVRDPLAGDLLVSSVVARHGGLDGVVMASGVVAFGDLVDTPDDAMEELFLTNVLGPLWLLRRLVPLLGERSGFVANLSAVVAETPLPGMSVYAASKAALSAADAALARELRRSGITVCDLRPPHTETGLAGRPLAGTAPRLPEGLRPDVVARRAVEAILAGEREVPSASFGS